MTFAERLQAIDRRFIYVLLALVIAGVLLSPIGLPIRISEETQLVYDAVDSLKPGSVLIISFDYGASNAPELHPSATAMMKHAFRKNIRVVCTALNIEGGMWAADAIKNALSRFPDKKYGVDYVNLGYKPGGQVFLEKFAVNAWDACAGVDASGNKIDQYPIMQSLKSAKDVSLAASMTSGEPGYPQWIANFGTPNKIPITAATVAPGVPTAIPLIRSGHLKGVLKGMRGAAEYELSINDKGTAVAGMDAQSLGHLTIVFFVVVGNIGYFLEKSQGKEAR